MMLVVANFADEDVTCKVVIPSHAFDFLGIPHKAVEAEDMLGGGRMTADFKNDDFVLVSSDDGIYLSELGAAGLFKQ